MHEQVLSFTCQGQSLTGVLASDPPAGQSTAETAVLIVVGGPQYRAGSHRQFVLLARSLAGAGCPALRFDVRGMGDSGGTLRSFEHLDEDIDAALNALFAAMPKLRRVVLWGLCDGASAALLKLHTRADARVAGLCLINPWVRSEQGLARTQLKHYYLQRLLQGSFWRKLFSGQVAGKALRELLQSLRLAAKPVAQAKADGPFQQRMAQGLAGFKGSTLVLLSSEDYTAKEFSEHCRSDAQWAALMASKAVTLRQLPGADHTCSDSIHQRLLEQETLGWLQSQGLLAQRA